MEITSGLRDIETRDGSPERTFMCTVNDDDMVHVQWLKDGVPIDDSLIGVKYFVTKDTSRFSLRLRHIDPSDEGTYTVRLEKDGKVLQSDGKLKVKKLELLEEDDFIRNTTSRTSVTSDSRKKKQSRTLSDEESVFDSPPFFHYTLEDETVKEGDRMVLSVTNTTMPEPDVEWFKDGIQVFSDEFKYSMRKDKGRYELIIHSCELSDDADWKAIGTNKFGTCESSCHLTVEKIDKPRGLEFLRELDNEIVFEKSILKLEVTVISDDPVTVTWFKDGLKVVPGKEFRVISDEKIHSLSILDVRKRHAGNYVVEAVSASGKAKTESRVTVRPSREFKNEEEEAHAPIIRMPLPPSRELPEGTEVILTCAVTGIPTPEITWYKDDQQVYFAGLTYSNGLAQLVIPMAAVSHSGVYTCVAKNEHGSVRSIGMVYITPSESKSNSAPKFIDTLINSSILENSEINLECTVQGKPPPSITWYHDGLKMLKDHRMMQYIDRNGTIKLSIMKGRPDDAGEYTCEAENHLGRDWTHCQVKVMSTGINRSRSPSPTPPRTNKAPIITRHLCDAKVHEGHRELLECEIDAHPDPLVEWFHDGNLVAESKTLRTYFDGRIAFLKLYEAHKDHQGVYECKIENKLGSVISKAEIIVEAAGESKEEYIPNMPRFISKLEDRVVLREGETVILTIEVDGNPEPKIKWLLNGKALKCGPEVETRRDGNHCELEIKSFNKKWAGTVTVVATNLYGDIHSSAEVGFYKDISEKRKPVKIERISVAERRSEHSSIPEEISEEPPTSVPEESLPPEPEEVPAPESEEPSTSAPLFSESLQDQTVLAGATATLKCVIKGIPRPEVSWTKDNEPLKKLKRYQFSYGEDGTCSLEIASCKASDAGIYMCTTKNDFGVVSSDCTLTVASKAGPDKHLVSADATDKSKEKPKFTRKPVPKITVSEGNKVEVIAKAVGEPTPTTTWMRDGREISRQNKACRTWLTGTGETVLEIECAVMKSSGKYSCVAVNSEGEDIVETEIVVTKKKLVTIQSTPKPPKFTEPLSDFGVVSGHPATLKCTVTGDPEPTLQWFFIDDSRKSIPISDLKSSPWTEFRQGEQVELKSSAVFKPQQGTYQCLATNEKGTVSTQCYLLVGETSEDVPAGPPRFIKCLRDTKSSLGETVELEVVIAGEPLPEVIWFHNNERIEENENYKITFTPPNKSTLTITTVSLPVIGRYTAEVENMYGAVKTSSQLMVGSESDGGKKKEKPKRTISDISATSDPRKIQKKGAPPNFLIGLADMDLTAGDTAAVAGKLAKKRRHNLEEDPKSLKESIVAKLNSIDDDASSGDYLSPTHSPMASRKNVESSTTLEEIRQAIITRNKNPCPPKLLVKPKPKKLIEEFKSLRLKTAISGNPHPNVQWDRNGVILETGNKFSIYNDGDFYYLEVHHFSSFDKGFYNCTATNSLGFATCTSEVEIEPEKDSPIEKLKKKLHRSPVSPSFIENLPEEMKNKPEQKVSLSCSVSGYPSPSITWMKDGSVFNPVKDKYSLFYDGECATLIFSEISVLDSGVYSCIAENTVGKESSQMKLIVEKPEIKDSEGSSPKFLNNKLKIRKTVDGNIVKIVAELIEGAEPITVKWLYNKMEIGENLNFTCSREGKNPVLVIKDAFPEDSGEYICMAENKYGSAKCHVDVTVTEQPKTLHEEVPQVKSLSKKITGLPSGVAELRFTATGKPEPVISWLKDNLQILPSNKFHTISDGNQFMLRITDLTAEDGGNYKLLAVNNAGTDQDTVNLEITTKANSSNSNKKLPKFIKHPVSVQCALGQTAQLDCEFEGEPTPVASWFLGPKRLQSSDGIEIISTNNSSKLIISKVDERHLGEYLCTVRNNIGEDLATAVIFLEDTVSVHMVEVLSKYTGKCGPEAFHVRPRPFIM
ncbi:hypothetical protein FO519_002966 [Halicephalobus sp. NKZ332]|nr:hypothetical protein FO519_002966 [Halicephalobus sp. NKZ332]